MGNVTLPRSRPVAGHCRYAHLVELPAESVAYHVSELSPSYFFLQDIVRRQRHRYRANPVLPFASVRTATVVEHQ